MKLLASALAAACFTAVVVAAAPALSVAPYRPQAVDFELAPPPTAGVARPGEFVSRPLRAPKRFNLVGLRWRGSIEPRVAVRTRKAGGDWSRWAGLSVDAEDGPDPGEEGPGGGDVSSPVWVGEADEVQYRVSRRVSGLRLHFVNVEGTATAADRTRTAVRRIANAAVTSVAGALGARTAGAQEPQPAMVPRSHWERGQCTPRAAPDYGEVKAAFVHHTVNLNDYTAEEAPGIVLAICRYHRNSNGWNDIGYNFLVDKYGALYEGRAGGVDQPVVGAQAQGYNSQTTGIANVGTYTSVPQSRQALEAVARLIRWKLPLHGAPTSGGVTLVSAGGGSNRYPAGARVRVHRVSGHRDTNSTSCPGEALYGQLPELRRLSAGAAPTRAATSLVARLPRRAARHGSRVQLSGRLLGPAGTPLAGEPIQVQVARGRRWRTVSSHATDAGGRFLATLRARVNRRVRARFPGRNGLAASSSRSVPLRVRPRITVSRPPRRTAPRATVRISGAVAPRKRRLHLVLQQRRRARFVRVGVRRVAVRGGRFRTFFVPARSGLYRFYVVAARDRSTERGRSAVHSVRVRRGSGAIAAPR